jgi:hypothetical protein
MKNYAAIIVFVALAGLLVACTATWQVAGIITALITVTAAVVYVIIPEKPGKQKQNKYNPAFVSITHKKYG